MVDPVVACFRGEDMESRQHFGESADAGKPVVALATLGDEVGVVKVDVEASVLEQTGELPANVWMSGNGRA